MKRHPHGCTLDASGLIYWRRRGVGVAVTVVVMFVACLSVMASAPALTSHRVRVPAEARRASMPLRPGRHTITPSPPGSACGHAWQSDYAALHARILAGHTPAKYAVALGADVGLADRLVGTFSVFFYALLSGRAFQIATYPGVVSLREAFEPAHVDWDRPDMDDDVVGNIK